jgi:pimeloyl-ACP methyl ester carboxylesterase
VEPAGGKERRPPAPASAPPSDPPSDSDSDSASDSPSASPRARRPARVLAALALAGLLALNGGAFLHARAMTRYVDVPPGERTRRPQDLSRWERLWVLATGVTVPRPRNERTPASAGLEFTTVELAARDGQRLEAWYLPAPAATPRAIAVLTPGYATSKGALLSPFDRLLSAVRARFALMGLPASPAAELLVFWGGVQRGIPGTRHDPVEYARSVRCPTLLLHGDRDPTVTVAGVREVFEALATDRKRFVVLEGVGHESYVGAQPEVWRRTVAAFLDELAP